MFEESQDKGFIRDERTFDGVGLRKIDRIGFLFDSTTLWIFEKEIQDLLNHHVKLYFVYTPLYYEATQKIININNMYDCFQRLANKYDIPILEYTNCYISYDSTFFYNAEHLNTNGATRFSNLFAIDLLDYINY